MKQAQVLLVVWLCCQKLFKCDFKAGVKVVAELNQLEHKIANADWVITGEGKFDQQT
jgi:glycerate kinase